MNTEKKSSPLQEQTSLSQAADGDYVINSEYTFMVNHVGQTDTPSGFENEVIFSVSADVPDELAKTDPDLLARYWRHDALVFPHNVVTVDTPIPVPRFDVETLNLSEADVASQVKRALDEISHVAKGRLGWASLAVYESRNVLDGDYDLGQSGE